jgi:hypothetical protein
MPLNAVRSGYADFGGVGRAFLGRFVCTRSTTLCMSVLIATPSGARLTSSR